MNVLQRGICGLYKFLLAALELRILENTCEGKENLKFAKENVLADIFHESEPSGNLITTGLGDNHARRKLRKLFFCYIQAL